MYSQEKLSECSDTIARWLESRNTGTAHCQSREMDLKGHKHIVLQTFYRNGGGEIDGHEKALIVMMRACDLPLTDAYRNNDSGVGHFAIAKNEITDDKLDELRKKLFAEIAIAQEKKETAAVRETRGAWVKT